MKKICVICGILISFAMTGCIVNAKKDDMQKELARQVLRFHVLANSDSEEDQNLKMQVKEAVIHYMQEEIPHSDSLEETKRWSQNHLAEIESVATEVIEKEGYSYQVKVELTTSDFPDKTYGDITFPSGTYEALRIEIGDAKGQNWWCVLYPNLCFIDAVHAVVPEDGKKELKSVLEEDTYQMVTSKTRFRVAWFFF